MPDRSGNGRPGDHRETFRASAGPREQARPGFGSVGWALAGAAGVAALAVLGAQRLDPPKRGRTRETDAANGWSDEPEVEYSITIERPADVLYRVWRDPETLPRIVAFLAEVRPSGEGRSEFGDVAARFFDSVVPKALASKALHAFKSLVLSGEIPTTDRQPAARRDPR
ncbi:MAG: hypothetical protein K0Q54_4769 [Methylobacterium brachiatum]|nr:hypothetical protein [Methylobacterium brachiatum]